MSENADMGQNWKPIDRVREYGNQTDFVETSEFPNEPIKHFIHNCNLTTCRNNENGKCTNEEKRKECVEISKKVLCIGYLNDDIARLMNKSEFEEFCRIWKELNDN